MKMDADRWLDEHPKVAVTLPDRPDGDWRDEEGYGWIFKVWFRTWDQSKAARNAIREAGGSRSSGAGRFAWRSATGMKARSSLSSSWVAGRM